MSLSVDRVCVIVGRTRHKMIQIELDEAVKRGARFIELRLDFLAKAIDFQRLLPHRKVPWIATLRRQSDGGRYTGKEEDRLTVIRQAIVAGFDWVDLETDIADKVRRFRDVKRIVSYHNMQNTPENLEEIYAGMLKQDADVYKVVTMAQHPNDSLRMLKLLKEAPKPTVGHCMGEIGLPSRFLSLKCGAPFMYAAFNKERGIAPGLPAYDDVRRFFAVNSINADTRVFGVIGDPVAHSYSPVLHNLLFRQYGVNAIYLPFRCPRGFFRDMIREHEALPIDGLSVTIPHKEAAAQLAVLRDDRVTETSAANTLVRKEDGFHAWNTDYEAAIEGLTDNMPTMEDGEVKKFSECVAMVLGAGGAARAVAHSLRRAGVQQLYVAGRSMDKVERLAIEVTGKPVEWGARHNVDCSILVNCTPVGMHPNLDECPVHGSYLKPGMVVFDTVYNPEQTMLIKSAKQRGCKVVTGVEMFVRQAALQFQLFTGVKPELEQMREILRRALSPATYRDEQGEDDEEL